MSDLIFSRTALFAVCYFALALAVSRLLVIGATRSIVFALLNVAAVWLIFFGTASSGVWPMSIYIGVIVLFWILLYFFRKPPGYLFVFGFLPPIALLIFAKTTGIFFVVGLSYMMFRCAHIEWELSKRKIEMMSLPISSLIVSSCQLFSSGLFLHIAISRIRLTRKRFLHARVPSTAYSGSLRARRK